MAGSPDFDLGYQGRGPSIPFLERLVGAPLVCVAVQARPLPPNCLGEEVIFWLGLWLRARLKGKGKSPDHS